MMMVITMLSVSSASLIVNVRYRLLLAFTELKLYSFTKFIDALRTKAKQIMNKYGVNASP